MKSLHFSLSISLWLILFYACTDKTQVQPIDPTEQKISADEKSIDVPKEKYLFAEYWVREVGLGTCSSKYIDGPLYSQYASNGLMLPHNCDGNPPYYSGELNLRGSAEITNNTTVLLGMGRQYCGDNWFGVYSVMLALDNLPYPILESDVKKTPFRIIENAEVIITTVVSNEGAIRVTFGRDTTVLKPYQSLTYSFEDAPEDACKRTTTYSFTNYGLVDKTKVILSP